LQSAHVENLSDASETEWGAYLIRDLKDYLALQISSLENCIRLAADVPGLEKPVTLLSTTVEGLKSLGQCNTWDEIVGHAPIEYGTLTFKKEHKGTQLAERIKAVRNACKDNLPKKLRAFADPSCVVLAHLQKSALAVDGLIHLVKEFRKRYQQHKKARRVLDFSDIEQLTLDLLLGKHRTGITSVAEETGSRFREIMVDEYQDSNEVQDAIFSALSQKRQNCFMVGDVKQSIYQFPLLTQVSFWKSIILMYLQRMRRQVRGEESF
jgi:ATP-dependent helicase/nuclease subunit A